MSPIYQADELHVSPNLCLLLTSAVRIMKTYLTSYFMKITSWINNQFHVFENSVFCFFTSYIFRIMFLYCDPKVDAFYWFLFSKNYIDKWDDTHCSLTSVKMAERRYWMPTFCLQVATPADFFLTHYCYLIRLHTRNSENDTQNSLNHEKIFSGSKVIRILSLKICDIFWTIFGKLWLK